MNSRSRRFFVAVVTLIPLLLGGGVSLAQSSREPEKETAIRTRLMSLLSGTGVKTVSSTSLSNAQTHKQVRVHWQSAAAGSRPGAANLEKQLSPGSITVLTSKKRDGMVPRERSLELSTNQILVLALDRNTGLRWWKILLDPRLVRSETVTASSEIHGEDNYLTKVDFVVEYPDDSNIRELRFYHPGWNGRDFHLELLSSLQVQ